MPKRPSLPQISAALMLFFSVNAYSALPEDVDIVNVHPTNTFPEILDYLQAPDDTDRFFAVRQSGQIHVIEDGTIAPTLFLNMGNLITTSGAEQGLLGLAFHPDFSINGLFYLNYTAGSSRPAGVALGDTIVAEFSVSADENVANPTPQRIIISVHQDFSNHNGGNIKFGPDGFLYIGMGDGGSGGDPCNRSQTLHPDDLATPFGCPNSPPDSAALLGKMLRLDVDNTTPVGTNNLCAAAGNGSANYAIPSGNPFADDTSTPACAETWSYGLRNPWRWSFDRDTGDLWIADVGQQRWEEVNLEPAGDSGRNYGWRVCEASYLTGTSTPCNLAGSTLPVLEYPINSQPECAITGGYRYRGPVQSLQGIYIFGDFCSGRIWFASDDGQGNWLESEFTQTGFDLRSFGEDNQGNVYVMRSGGVWLFHGETGVIFHDRFETDD